MSPDFNQDIDVVVGAQYGDEGKGMVAKLLADRAEEQDNAYKWTGRVGAQNAEHRFIHHGCELTARILPSASANRDITSILGAGHCFRPEQLALEAVHLGVSLDDVFVDEHGMWLTEDHATGSHKDIANARATTGWGVGAALAEKVRRHPNTRLMREYESSGGCAFRVIKVPSLLDKIEGSGLIEGSQGTMLSLNHGYYPYCTGKDVTVPAILGEMGLGVRRLRHVYGVIRLVMVRVPGSSGPTGGKEITFDQVEQGTGLRIPQHRRLQGDTMRWGSGGQEERLFELSLSEIRYANLLNNFDYLVVTFADYHRPGNYRATSWDTLHADTRVLIEQLNKEVAPVVLVRTGQGEHDNIWL